MNLRFRAWDVGEEEFIYSQDLGLSEFWAWVSYHSVRAEHIQQSTGLKDINGREIYAGDLCKARKANSYLNGIYEVAWHETKGRWYYKNQPEYKDLYQVGCAGNSKCQVVGNIFENPK